MKKSLIDLSHLGLKSPLIQVSDIAHFVESIENSPLKKSERFIANAIVRLVEVNSGEYLSITDICLATSKKETTVRQHLNSIFDSGLFQLSYCNVSKTINRRSILYRYSKELIGIESKVINSDVSGIELDVINQSYISKDDELHGKMDSLITSVLFSSLQFNRKGKLKENSVNTYLHNNDMLNVKAVSKSDNVVAYVKDLRVYLAVLKLIHDIIVSRIYQHRQSIIQFDQVVSTVFDIRGVDILVTMGQGDGSGERSNLDKAMLRLDGTGYVIKAPDWFNHKHSLSSGVSRVDHFRIRFNAETKSRSLIYKIELEQSMVRRFYQEILDGTSILTFTDPQLFAVKNDFSFAFLLACQRIKPGKVTPMSWSDMKDMFAPGFSIKDFKTKLTNMLEKNIVESQDGSRLWIIDGKTRFVSECECFYNNVSITLYDGEFQLIRTPSRIVLANTLSKRSTQSFRKEVT